MTGVSLWPSGGDVGTDSVLAQLFATARDTALEQRGARAHASRDPAHRRRYAGDPWAYIADVLGWHLSPQQEEALALIERADRVLLPSANNQGKTFILGAYGLYRLDAVAALPDPDRDLPEQGARILLPGPDHQTILKTIYAEMLAHAARAEQRGHLMPGERSERSVLWHVRPRWDVEAFSPPKATQQNVAHTASGRHHRNQIALIEEGQGVPEQVWRATEGMCSSSGNKIVSSFNPTESRGPAYRRARSGSYRVYHLSAFAHPNVTQRALVIPDAVDFRVVDDRVAAECVDRGPLGEQAADAQHHDFAYALPPKGRDGEPAAERGARPYGILGHPDGVPHVYRPGATFTAQVLGQWPGSASAGLFDPAAIDAAMARWRLQTDPLDAPDAVGLDPAREGSDDSCLAPRWGEGAESLLLAYAAAAKDGAEAVRLVREQRRMRVGRIQTIPKGDGPFTASEARKRFPSSPMYVDEGGVGASVYDHGRRVLHMDMVPVSFGSVPPSPTPGEPWSENLRAAMYVRAARLVALGLVDVPDDPQLRDELLVHFTVPRYRVVVVPGQGRKRVETVLLPDKETVIKPALGGRSPDRADAFVLAVNDFPPVQEERDLSAFAPAFNY